MSYQARAKCIGIEYDERIFAAAEENLRTAVSAEKVEFRLGNAESFQVPPEVNRCYFFNPFSVEVLKSVLARIRESYYESPREILLFFYYPSAEYISYLMTVEDLSFFDEIDCRDLFEEKSERERIMIFQIL